MASKSSEGYIFTPMWVQPSFSPPYQFFFRMQWRVFKLFKIVLPMKVRQVLGEVICFWVPAGGVILASWSFTVATRNTGPNRLFSTVLSNFINFRKKKNLAHNLWPRVWTWIQLPRSRINYLLTEIIMLSYFIILRSAYQCAPHFQGFFK